MARQQRRQSKNGRYMRMILDRLREYDLDEIRIICERWKEQNGGRLAVGGKRRGS